MTDTGTETTTSVSPDICSTCGLATGNVGDDPLNFPTVGLVASLLPINAGPDDAQCHNLLRDRAGIADKHKALQQYIKDRESELVELKKREKHLHHLLDDYRTVLHPLRRMPSETLTKIFHHTQPTTADFRSRVQEGDDYSPPWYLGQISRRLRQVAISSPHLWSHVGITEEETTASAATRTQAHQIFRLCQQLKRSGNVSLTVVIKAAVVQHGDFLSLLAATSSDRWEYLSIELPIEAFPHLRAVHGSLDRLHDLIISGADGISDEDARKYGLSDMFRFAPLLRTIEATSMLISQCELPWAQIEKFNDTCIEPDLNVRLPSMYAALEKFSSLTTLTAFPTIFGNDQSLLHWSIRSSSIRNLDLSSICEFPFTGMLKAFDFPNLDHLVLPFYDSDGEYWSKMDLEHISNTLDQFELIRSMGFSYHPADPPKSRGASWLTPLFKSRTKLTSLHFGEGILATPDFVEKFGDPDFLPALQRLGVEEDVDENEKAAVVDAVNEMKEKRPGLAINLAGIEM